MIVEIQCLPNPPGVPSDSYRHVEAAITEVQRSGLVYEVGALGTTVEGDPDVVWPLVRSVHEACLRSGAEGLVTVVKVEQSAGEESPTIRSLTGKFRR